MTDDLKVRAEQQLAAIEAVVAQCEQDRHPEPKPGETVYSADEPCELCLERIADAAVIRDLLARAEAAEQQLQLCESECKLRAKEQGRLIAKLEAAESRLQALQQNSRELAAGLRERTWLAPLSAEEMNRRDEFLARKLDELELLASLTQPGAASPRTLPNYLLGEPMTAAPSIPPRKWKRHCWLRFRRHWWWYGGHHGWTCQECGATTDD